MKFSCSVDIDLPRERVIELFENPDNMRHWQDGFVSFQHHSGTPGKIGAQNKLVYDIRGKEMTLLETITRRDSPEVYHGTYEGDFGKNSMNNNFIALGTSQTRWESEIEYTQTNGLIMKIMSKLLPGVFRRQTQKWMDQFKTFAEGIE